MMKIGNLKKFLKSPVAIGATLVLVIAIVLTITNIDSYLKGSSPTPYDSCGDAKCDITESSTSCSQDCCQPYYGCRQDITVERDNLRIWCPSCMLSESTANKFLDVQVGAREWLRSYAYDDWNDKIAIVFTCQRSIEYARFWSYYEIGATINGYRQVPSSCQIGTFPVGGVISKGGCDGSISGGDPCDSPTYIINEPQHELTHTVVGNFPFYFQEGVVPYLQEYYYIGKKDITSGEYIRGTTNNVKVFYDDIKAGRKTTRDDSFLIADISCREDSHCVGTILFYALIKEKGLRFNHISCVLNQFKSKPEFIEKAPPSYTPTLTHDEIKQAFKKCGINADDLFNTLNPAYSSESYPNKCGDGFCHYWEYCNPKKNTDPTYFCSQDCGYCGDGICRSTDELCEPCLQDCGTTTTIKGGITTEQMMIGGGVGVILILLASIIFKRR